MTAAIDDGLFQPRVSLGALAAAFLTVSLFGFGGGVVWAHRIAVERRRWLTEAEFLDIVSLCQFLPGPNVVGIAVCTGARLRGAAGALAAVGGFLVIPWAVGLAVGVTCLGHARTPVLRHILGGVSATAAGLLIATGLRLLLAQHRRPATIVFAALALALLAFAKVPLYVVLIALTPLSIGWVTLFPAASR